ncbi:hypothetical protein EV401DRAFT_1853747 [Pisolithus croceorrhizus]|nr:hypothetical protein EV401DRAFT_1853747 [Pisolithus croceorrhizus]
MLFISPGWSLLVLVTGFLANPSLRATAQQTNVTCLPQFNWMDNSKNQNPCLVSAYVQSVCFGGQFAVTSLGPGTEYVGPYVDEANDCECSSVTYSLVSACAYCQSYNYVSWPYWVTNCSSPYVGYSENIPSGTAIPQWAYQNVTLSGTFNVTLAQVVGDSPESTATSAQVTASSISTSTDLTASLTPTPKSNNTGAIVGGAVGGVVGLAAIAAVATWFFVRCRRQVTPARYADDGKAPAATNDMQIGTSPFSFARSQPPLYDPSDPSTFPTSPTMQAVYSDGYQNLYTHSALNGSPGQRPMGYTGAPEP